MKTSHKTSRRQKTKNAKYPQVVKFYPNQPNTAFRDSRGKLYLVHSNGQIIGAEIEIPEESGLA